MREPGNDRHIPHYDRMTRLAAQQLTEHSADCVLGSAPELAEAALEPRDLGPLAALANALDIYQSIYLSIYLSIDLYIHIYITLHYITLHNIT